MLTISIYRGDQRRKAHAALDGDLPQTVPELVFKTDAGPVVCNSNRALRNRRVQASQQTCHRYYAFLEVSEAMTRIARPRSWAGFAAAAVVAGQGASSQARLYQPYSGAHFSALPSADLA